MSKTVALFENYNIIQYVHNSWKYGVLRKDADTPIIKKIYNTTKTTYNLGVQ